MMRRSIRMLSALVLLAAFLPGGCVRDQHAPRTRLPGVDKKPEPEEQRRVAAQHERGEEEREGCGADAAGGELPEWMQLTAEHDGLKKFVGEWTAETKFWMAPGAEPTVSMGTASSRIVFDGRFLQQSYKGELMGAPFEGLLHLGYDTVGKEFVFTWIDGFSPYLYVYRGPKREDGIHFAGREPEPMTGKMQDSWMKLRWVHADQYVLEMWSPLPDGSRHQGGEIVYTRKK